MIFCTLQLCLCSLQFLSFKPLSRVEFRRCQSTAMPCSRRTNARAHPSSAPLRDLYVLGHLPRRRLGFPLIFEAAYLFSFGTWQSINYHMAVVPTASAAVEQRWQTLVAEAQTAFLLACTLKQAEPSAHASNEQFFSVILQI
jgi:hypothetical protein